MKYLTYLASLTDAHANLTNVAVSELSLGLEWSALHPESVAVQLALCRLLRDLIVKKGRAGRVLVAGADAGARALLPLLDGPLRTDGASQTEAVDVFRCLAQDVGSVKYVKECGAVDGLRGVAERFGDEPAGLRAHVTLFSLKEIDAVSAEHVQLAHTSLVACRS